MESKVITSEPVKLKDYFLSIWTNRHLIFVFVKRDLKVKYAQTFLGVVWAVIQPLVAVFIYTVFFYMILKINTGETPYPLFVLPGILAWFHFTKIIDDVGTSLQQNREIIHKMDFPKMILPISKLFLSLLDVVITLTLFFILMVIYNYPLTWHVLIFPIFLLINVLTGFSIAIWLSALTIRFRDFHHIIPYLITFGIWITPVFYPSTIVPPSLEKYMYLNPIGGVLAGYRWSLLNLELPSWKFVIGFIPIVIFLITGIVYFLKIDNDIVDHV